MAAKIRKTVKPAKAAGVSRKAAPSAVAGKANAKGKGTEQAKVRRRFWLTYPPKRIKTPVIWELGNRFEIMTNIRQASVTDEVGIVCLEVEASPDELDAGLRWLKKLGLSVEPIELSTVAG